MRALCQPLPQISCSHDKYCVFVEVTLAHATCKLGCPGAHGTGVAFLLGGPFPIPSLWPGFRGLGGVSSLLEGRLLKVCGDVRVPLGGFQHDETTQRDHRGIWAECG